MNEKPKNLGLTAIGYLAIILVITLLILRGLSILGISRIITFIIMILFIFSTEGLLGYYLLQVHKRNLKIKKKKVNGIESDS